MTFSSLSTGPSSCRSGTFVRSLAEHHPRPRRVHVFSSRAARTRTVGAFLAAFAVFAPSAVYAQKKGAPPAPHGSPKVRSLAETLPKEAKSEYDDAFVLVQNSDFKGALAKFEAAYRKFPDPRLLWNMATCEKNLQRYDKSLTLVRRYIEEGKGLLLPADIQEAKAIEEGLASLTTTMKFTLRTPGALVFVDGEPVASPEQPLLVNVGEHVVTAKKEDHVDFLTKVSGPGRGAVEVPIVLTPMVHEARLAIKAGGADSIAIDGKVVATGSYSGTVKSGGHTVRVTAPGRVTYEKEVSLRDHETRDLSVSLEEKKGSVLPWVLVGVGVVAAAGAATGIYLVAKPGREDGVPRGSLPPSIVNTSYSF